MRVVLISRILPAVNGYTALLRELGHEPIGLLCTREREDRYGGLADLVREAPAELDIVIPATRAHIAPLLRSLAPELALCTGFPWKIPPDALAVPEHGIVLSRAETGDPGDVQDESDASYLSFFEPEYAWIDWSRPAAEIERQVRAWRFHSPMSPHGALTELDGETVRVLRVSLEATYGREMQCGDGTLWIVEKEPA